MKKEMLEAIGAVLMEDYLRGLVLFTEIYAGQEQPGGESTASARGLSYYGLCMALVKRRFKPAIELCKRAIELQFYSGEHYANLARVYLAAGNRKKAWETLEAGLKNEPDHAMLLDAQKALGIRARPALPLLGRENPINVALGRSRYAKRIGQPKKKQK